MHGGGGRTARAALDVASVARQTVTRCLSLSVDMSTISSTFFPPKRGIGHGARHGWRSTCGLEVCGSGSGTMMAWYADVVLLPLARMHAGPQPCVVASLNS